MNNLPKLIMASFALSAVVDIAEKIHNWGRSVLCLKREINPSQVVIAMDFGLGGGLVGDVAGSFDDFLAVGSGGGVKDFVGVAVGGLVAADAGVNLGYKGVLAVACKGDDGRVVAAHLAPIGDLAAVDRDNLLMREVDNAVVAVEQEGERVER